MRRKKKFTLCLFLTILLFSGCMTQAPNPPVESADNTASISINELEADLPSSPPEELCAVLDEHGIPKMSIKNEVAYQAYIEPFIFSFVFLNDFGPNQTPISCPDVLYAVLSDVEETQEVSIDRIVSTVSASFPTNKAYIINTLGPIFDPRTETCMVSSQTDTDSYVGTVLEQEENDGVLSLTCFWYNKSAGEYLLYGTSRTWIDITDPSKPYFLANRFKPREVIDWSLTEIDESFLKLAADAGLFNQAWSTVNGISAEAFLSYYYLNDPYIDNWSADAIESFLIDLFSGFNPEYLRTSPYYDSTLFRGEPGYKTVRNVSTTSVKADRLQCVEEIYYIDLSCTDTVTGNSWKGTLCVSAKNGKFQFISYTIK